MPSLRALLSIHWWGKEREKIETTDSVDKRNQLPAGPLVKKKKELLFEFCLCFSHMHTHVD